MHVQSIQGIDLVQMSGALCLIFRGISGGMRRGTRWRAAEMALYRGSTKRRSCLSFLRMRPTDEADIMSPCLSNRSALTARTPQPMRPPRALLKSCSPSDRTAPALLGIAPSDVGCFTCSATRIRVADLSPARTECPFLGRKCSLPSCHICLTCI